MIKKLSLLILLVFLAGCNPPDDNEYTELGPAYRVCFSKVEKEINVDLNDFSAMQGEKEHYQLARNRIVSAINEVSEHLTTGKTLGRYITKTGAGYKISLKYLIALEDSMRASPYYPLYDFECLIDASMVQ